MAMPGRTYSPNGYRYGFNGKENEKDISEGGQDYGMRIYDSRIGKFLSVDPLTKKYPELTPYQFASNRPVDGIDLDGLEWCPPMKSDNSGRQIVDYEAARAIHTDPRNLLTVYMAADIFLTKGWMTRILIGSQAGGLLEHNTATTPEGKALQNQRFKENFTDLSFTIGGAVIFGKILGAIAGDAAIAVGTVQKGVLKDATFAQNKIHSEEIFSPQGQKIYSELANKPITTVNDLANALKEGSITPKQVPLDFVTVNGQNMILNTRTSTALNRAGIPIYEWYGINKTGLSVPGLPGITYDNLAQKQIETNKLPDIGTPKIPK